MNTKEQRNKFPKGFFSKQRPEITLKDSLKDVIVVKWKKVKNTRKGMNLEISKIEKFLVFFEAFL